MGRGRGVGRTGRGSGRGSNIQRSSIVEEDETGMLNGLPVKLRRPHRCLMLGVQVAPQVLAH
eukprot:scaffold8997_cov116-Isochrysis_galbana.AAC.5